MQTSEGVELDIIRRNVYLNVLKVICVMKTVKQNLVNKSAELYELEEEWRNID